MSFAAPAALQPSLAANMTTSASHLRPSNAWTRSKESPMDWNFTEPRGGAGSLLGQPSSSGENRKRSHDETAHGAPQSAFSFHAPLSPAIPGPEVEMVSQTPPQHSKEHGLREEAKSAAEDGHQGQDTAGVAATQGKGRKAKGASATAARQTTGTRRAGKARQRDDGYEHNLALAKEAQERFNVHNYFLGAQGASEQAVSGHASSSKPKLMDFDPEWCLGMAQFLFNSSLLAGLLWIGFQVAQTIRRDVADKITEYEMELVSEIARCSQSYSLNRCGTDLAAPALASACAAWERCAAKDPAVVGRARVTAETFAEILNGFVDAVSWKTMIFSLATLMIVVGATNSTLSFFRIKSRQSHQQQQHQLHQAGHAPGHATLGYTGAHAFPQSFHHQPYPYAPHAGGIPLRSHDARAEPRKPSLFSWRRDSPTSTPARKRVCSDVVKSFDEELDALR